MNLEDLNRQIIVCRKCPRLVAWRETIANKRRRAFEDWQYWGKPVPGFGDPIAKIMAVGLAPGAHGSNRTGRQFTGDASGAFLYPALHRAHLANQPHSIARNDGLTLKDLFITASARCVPPSNKPTTTELANCQSYLEQEILLIKPKVIVCLGRVAYESVLRILNVRETDFKFAHGACYRTSWGPVSRAPWLLCSYHPSQQNTQTGRLTVAMFDEIWAHAKELTGDS